MKNEIKDAREALRSARSQEALEVFLRIIQDDPNDPLAYNGAAVCLFTLGREAEAMSMNEKALALKPNLGEVRAVRSHIYYAQGNLEKSRTEARVAYELEPDSPEILVFYGLSLFRDERFEEAIAVWERAVKLDPNLFEAHHNLAWAYLHEGNAKGYRVHAQAIYHLRPSLKTGFWMIYAKVNLRRPILSVIFLLVTVLSLFTHLYWLLIIPYFYLLLIVGARILLLYPRKQR